MAVKNKSKKPITGYKSDEPIKIEGYSIDVSTKEVRTVADHLETNNNKIRDEFDDVDRTLFNLFGSWEGDARSSAEEKYKDIKKKYVERYGNRYNVIQQYVEILRNTTADVYEEVEEVNTQIAEAYK